MGLKPPEGLNKEQCRILGIKYPIRAGWSTPLIGTEITQKKWKAFIFAKTDRHKELFGNTPYGSKGGRPNRTGFRPPKKKWD